MYYRVKIKENKKEARLNLPRELKNMEHERDGNTNCKWLAWNDPQKLCKGVRYVGKGRMSQDHLNYSMKEFWRPEETCCLWDSSKKPSSNAGVKGTHGICTTQNPSSLGFLNTSGSPNFTQTTRPYNSQQKKVNLPNCGPFCPGWP